jgi:hypothetical protein
MGLCEGGGTVRQIIRYEVMRRWSGLCKANEAVHLELPHREAEVKALSREAVTSASQTWPRFEKGVDTSIEHVEDSYKNQQMGRSIS